MFGKNADLKSKNALKSCIFKGFSKKVISLIFGQNVLTNRDRICYNNQALRGQPHSEGANLENDTEEEREAERSCEESCPRGERER